MRAIFYWLTSLAIAVFAAGAADQPVQPETLVWIPDASIHIASAAEPSRAVLLAAGIMAIAYTYRHAWLNFKSRG